MSENKRELVLDAINGKKTSRVPVGFWFHFVHPEIKDAFADESIPQQNIDGHKHFFEKFQPDFVKLMSDGYFNYPNEILKNISSADDLLKIKPLGKDHKWIRQQVELVKKQRANFSYNPVTFYNLFSPATSLKILIGAFDNSAAKQEADLIIQNKEAVKYAFDVIAQDLSDLAQAVITEGGADGIYLSAQNIQDERIDEKLYKEVVAPSEIKILEAAQKISKYNVLHICGYEGARNHLEWYKDYPVAIVNWAAVVEGVPLEEGRKIFGDRAVIGGFGNTKKDILFKRSEEEIKKQTKEILEKSGREKIILGADCTVPYDIDLKHLEWVREAAV